jgi:prepilin-type N-terminal cleavage/methylation domain-containing protein
MRKSLRENKGYSLVEMIIVIAIIAILSAGAMVTVTLINSAKSKEAGVTFDSEVSNLIAKSKSQIPKFKLTAGDSEVEHKDYYFAIAVYKDDDGKYYLANGYYSKSSGFKTYDCENANDGKGKSISSRVAIDYTEGSKNSGLMTVDIDGTSVDSAYVVAFDRTGRCVSGVGTYSFRKSSTDVVLDEVTINANGSHQSK